MLLFARLVYLMFVLSLTEVCSMSKSDSYKRDKRFWFRFDKKETSNQPKKGFDTTSIALLEMFQKLIASKTQNESEFKRINSLYKDWLQREIKKNEMEKYWLLRQG